MVEFQIVVGEGFSRAERIRGAAEAADLAGQLSAGRFQVALKAYVQAPVGWKPLGIDDGGSDLLGLGFAAGG